MEDKDILMVNPKYWLINTLLSWLDSFGSLWGLPGSTWFLILLSIGSLAFGLWKAKKYWGVDDKPHGGGFIAFGIFGVFAMTLVVLIRIFKQ